MPVRITVLDDAARRLKVAVVREVEDVMRLRGLSTRVELARLTGQTPQALSHWLSLHTGMQLSALSHVAEALNCDVEVNLICRGTPEQEASGDTD